MEPRERPFEKYKVADVVPEGESGPWKVSRFHVDAQMAQFERLRMIVTGRMRGVPEGHYTALTRHGSTIMSDTPDEIRDHIGVIVRASGRVLIHGLGLGMVARACLLKPEVTHVTVVDNSHDVIRLVGMPLAKWAAQRETENGGWNVEWTPDGKEPLLVTTKRLRIVFGDAYTWQPERNERWDVAWHDIWDDICADNLQDMHRLHRRFGRRCSWQGSWARAECELQERRDRRQWSAWR